MAYQINKTSGALLVSLADGQIDTTSSDITLVGKGAIGFGESINENFVKMLENFAGSSAPSNPLAGQIWWDTSVSRLKVYNGANWTTGGGPIVQPLQPTMVAGDMWINNDANQLYFFDGTDLTLAGPIYTSFQGRSGPEVVTVLDDTGTSRTIVKQWVGGTFVGLWSKIGFTPQNVDTIPNFTGDVEKGFNVVDNDFLFAGRSSNTTKLVDAAGTERTAEQFLASDSDDATSGALTVRNNNGLTVGLTDNHNIKVTADGVVAENNISNQKYIVRTTNADGKNDTLTIDAQNKRVGINQSNPNHTLDVTGDMRITGNFTVEGTSTTLSSTEIVVEDKSITLGKPSDSTALGDSDLDEAGMIIASSDGNKEFLWHQATNAWTTNVSIDLETGAKIKANGVDIIDGTAAPGITSIGSLTSATIGNMTIDGVRIQSASTDLNGDGFTLDIAGPMKLTTTQRISNVSDPINAQDVATKAYVDSSIDTEVIPLALDITGLGTGATLNNNIALIINDIAPTTVKRDGTEARVHCTTTTGATATLTGAALDTAFNESTTLVQQLDNGGNDDGSVSVIQSATFNDASGSIASTVSRSLKLFRIVSGSWTWVQDLTSSV